VSCRTRRSCDFRNMDFEWRNRARRRRYRAQKLCLFSKEPYIFFCGDTGLHSVVFYRGTRVSCRAHRSCNFRDQNTSLISGYLSERSCVWSNKILCVISRNPLCDAYLKIRISLYISNGYLSKDFVWRNRALLRRYGTFLRRYRGPFCFVYRETRVSCRTRRSCSRIQGLGAHSRVTELPTFLKVSTVGLLPVGVHSEVFKWQLYMYTYICRYIYIYINSTCMHTYIYIYTCIIRTWVLLHSKFSSEQTCLRNSTCPFA